MSRWDMQLLGCFEKGIQAYNKQIPIEACPYIAHRGVNRQRADYWRDGWRAARNDMAYKEHRALREASV